MRRRIRIIALLCLLAPHGWCDVTLSGTTVATTRHRTGIAPSGLPAQIEITAIDDELPLELRGQQPAASDLAAIGRGPQLRAPMRVVMAANGQESEAQVQKPARPVAADGNVTCSATAKAGPLSVQLTTTYSEGGLFAELTFSGSGQLDQLALVIEPRGVVDLVVAGNPLDTPVANREGAPLVPSPEEGTAWENGTTPGTTAGLVKRLFVGSGDRGWTWLCDEAPAGFIDPAAPTMSLARDEAGDMTWRILLVNRATKIKGKHTFRFALLTHPARVLPVDHRRQAWLAWPHGPSSRPLPETSFAMGQQSLGTRFDLLPAASATPYEALCAYGELSGTDGGDAASAEVDHVATFPGPLFRWLAAPFCGQVRRIVPNAAALVRPGSDRTLDRSLLGRALLHDIGLDAARLTHLAEAGTVVRALQEFGYFEPDGQTEFIPYWRVGRVLRFGEVFSTADAFSLTTENPVDRVHVSVYRRPARTGARPAKALIVIMNESGGPIRDQLYVTSPAGLFGGPNRLTDGAVVSAYDFSSMPNDSDWSKPGLLSNRYKSAAVLKDAEDGGTVRLASDKDGIEAYGPSIFIRPHDFRLFFATGQK